jgi:hypothetical protein
VCIARRWCFATPPPTEVHVETFEQGWIWFARDMRGDAMLQFFLSVERRPLPAGAGLLAHYMALVDRLPVARELLDGAEPMGRVHVRDAGTALCAEPIAAGHARVGEAALTIDPLAGHGVFEAVGGALTLAASLNTLLRHTGRSELAQRFYRDRLRHDFVRMARTGRDFYAMEQRWPDAEFWRDRRGWPDDEPSHAGLSGEARVQTMPVVVNDFVEQREVLVTADQPRGIWQVAGVPLVPLLRRARRIGNDAAALSSGGHAGDNTATALAWLRHRGLIGPAGGGESPC